MDNVILYRASRREQPYLGQWACWTPDLDAAVAYTDNPGFGGPQVYEATIRPEYVLDLRSARNGGYSATSDPLATLAAALYEDAEERAEALAEWRDRSWHVYDVWQDGSAELRERLASLYSWVRYYDDYPQHAETWVGLEPAPIAAEPIEVEEA